MPAATNHPGTDVAPLKNAAPSKRLVCLVVNIPLAVAMCYLMYLLFMNMKHIPLYKITLMETDLKRIFQCVGLFIKVKMFIGTFLWLLSHSPVFPIYRLTLGRFLHSFCQVPIKY